jgi:predicted MFS family arabinose efflux permease
VTSAFHLAVNIPASFWDYYIMVVIGGNESWVTVKNIAMLSSKAIALRTLAPLIDSMGAKRSLYISMAAVSPIPLLYYNATSVFELVGTSVFSSIAWAPWDVASALYVYYLVSEDRRPAFTSLQNISSNIAATLGSAIGSWIGAHLGIYHVFLTSSILRLAIAMLAYRMTPELKHFSSHKLRSSDPRR